MNCETLFQQKSLPDPLKAGWNGEPDCEFTGIYFNNENKNASPFYAQDQ